MISNVQIKPVRRTRGYRCAVGSRDLVLHLVERFAEKFRWEPPVPFQRHVLPPVADQVTAAFDKLEDLICDHVPIDEQEQYFYAIHHLMKWEGITSHYETVRQERRNSTSKAIKSRAAVKFEDDKETIINSLVEAHWRERPEDQGRWEPTAEAIIDDVNAQFSERYEEGRMDKPDISKRRLAARIAKSFGTITTPHNDIARG